MSTASHCIALLSDVHANLPALEAVLEHIGGDRSIDATYHLGDVVGYAPWPNETIALLRERGIAGVAGNYDSTVATHYEHCGCRYEDPVQESLAHESYAWTLEHTSDASKQWLAALPFRLDVRAAGGHAAGPTLILVHGTPQRNTVYWSEDRPDAFCLKMAAEAGARAGDLIAFGHTHKPWWRVVDGIHFVNTGSVGRPKDGDPRAGYVVVSVAEDGLMVEFRRVDYDLARSVSAIRASTLPNAFAHYLESGGTRIEAAPGSPEIAG